MIDEELRLLMEDVGRKLAARINADLPPGIGFALLLYEFGEGERRWLSYIANGKREDMIKTMKEFISINEHGQVEVLGKGH